MKAHKKQKDLPYGDVPPTFDPLDSCLCQTMNQNPVSTK